MHLPELPSQAPSAETIKRATEPIRNTTEQYQPNRISVKTPSKNLFISVCYILNNIFLANLFFRLFKLFYHEYIYC